MAADLLPSDPILEQTVEDTLLTSLPREADSAQVSEPEKEASSQSGGARRPVWLDGAVSAANQAGPPPVPRPTSRPKRGMDASPFAGLMSKKPFRRRTFEPIKEEPDTAESTGPHTAAEPSIPDTSGDTINTSNLLSRLPSIPTVVTTNTFMQISISPQIWRTREEAKNLMMRVGLQGIQLDGQNDLQLYLWSTLNPRIVTTGIPRPASQGDLAERSMSAGWSSDRDDEEGSKMTSPSFGGTATIGNKKCCDGLLLDEVFLVRRDPQRRIPDEVFHTMGPFESSSPLCLPDWPGDIWRFDLCCRVNIGTDEIVWVKSLDKRMQP